MERRFEALIKKSIVWRKDPVDFEGSDEYEWGWHFHKGTYECYTLFINGYKIHTYKSLKWHLSVLWHINPQLNQRGFNEVVDIICHRRNGFILFDVPSGLKDTISYEISMQDLEKPPPNKLRKIIFKTYCKLTNIEKLKIVGTLVGRHAISNSEIYDSMLMLHDDKRKITVKSIALHLNCSERTIYRNMDNELKKEKELLNAALWT